MHELSLTESVRYIVVRHAEQAGARRVNEIYLVIGELASIVDDSVQFYWDIIAKDSLAEGARLHFRRIPAEMRCQDCQTVFQPAEDCYDCPNCHSNRVLVSSGQEFFIESIDIET
jgi:hydrogenase nickel incorporation protein HypA/HybF